VIEVVKTLGQVAQAWFTDPQKAMEAQSRLGTQFVELWGATLKRMQGEQADPVAKPEQKDSRFADPEWSQNPIFDFLKQAYLITSRWAEGLVEGAQGVDEHTRHKAGFYVRQISSALSPSNFLATNPELIRETIRENGANLVRGMQMLAEDIEAGRGELKVRQSDPGRFKVGVNMANTPGKVVFRNELIELIQYAPATDKVLKRPLLIVPPWINKFYVLDLNPEKSFIRWAVSQGLTVFCISWVNPDERHAEKGFEHYMREGIFAALDAVRGGHRRAQGDHHRLLRRRHAARGRPRLHGGQARQPIESATFFTTQVDFENAGDLKVFVDEEQISAAEADMKARGYLKARAWRTPSTCCARTT
jgi:polyhydroxyalkanoate synthase